jgi:hypothetical protein
MFGPRVLVSGRVAFGPRDRRRAGGSDRCRDIGGYRGTLTTCRWRDGQVDGRFLLDNRRRGEVARDWWDLVEAGTYARRRGRSKTLADTTVADYRGVLFGTAKKPKKPSDRGPLVLIDRCG